MVILSQSVISIATSALDEGMESVQDKFNSKLIQVDEKFTKIKSGMLMIREALSNERKLNGKERKVSSKYNENSDDEDY